jgi:hypothetical protein
MATKKNIKAQSKKTVYSVLRGGLDDYPERVTVIGLFTSIEEARKRVLKEYRRTACEDLVDEGGRKQIPKAFRVLDNGYEFWTIATHRV